MKYLYFSYIILKRKLTYRFDIIMGCLLVLVTGVASKFFWEGLVHVGKLPQEDLNKYISYSAIAAVLGSIYTSEIIMNVSEKVRWGQVASDLQKPIDFQLLCMADSLGGMLGGAITDFLPRLIIMKIVADIYIPSTIPQILLFLLSCLLGYFILMLIDYLISLLSFYFVEMWAFIVIKGVVIGVCSGLYLPLWLYPEKLLKVLDILPFKHLYFVPINIYLSVMNPKEALEAIAVQLVWLAALLIGGRLATAATLRKLTVAGG